MANAIKTIEFTLNGEPAQFEAPADQLFLEALRETFKIKSVKSGCSPQRRMRRVPDAVQRSAEARLRGPLRAGPGPVDHDARGRQRQRAATLRRRLPGGRRPAMRVLHARAGAAHKMDHRPGRATVSRRDGEAPRRASLPLHRLRQDPRRGRVDTGRQAQRRRAAGGDRGRRSRQAAPALPGRGARFGNAAVRRRHRRARPPLRGGRAVAPCARPGATHRRVEGAARCPGSPRIATAADVPGDRWVGQILRRLAGLRRRGRGGALCRRRAGGGRGRDAAPRPRSRGAHRGRLRAVAPSARPRRSDQAGRAAGQSEAR